MPNPNIRHRVMNSNSLVLNSLDWSRVISEPRETENVRMMCGDSPLPASVVYVFHFEGKEIFLYSQRKTASQTLFGQFWRLVNHERSRTLSYRALTWDTAWFRSSFVSWYLSLSITVDTEGKVQGNKYRGAKHVMGDKSLSSSVADLNTSPSRLVHCLQ